MKYLWTNNKDKLVLSEEGKVDENLERVPKPNKCQIIMKILKVILALEIILLIGSAVLLLYKAEYYDSAKTENIETKLNSASFLPTLKLTGENLKIDQTPENPIIFKPNELLVMKNLLNTNNEDANKEKILQNELSHSNELPNGENNAKSEEKNSNQEINSPSEQTLFKKIFAIRLSLPFNNKEIVDSQETQNSPAIADDSKNESFHIRILFKRKNPNENQTDENIINPLLINRNPLIPLLNDIRKEEFPNENILDNNMKGVDNFLSKFMKPDIVSDFFNPFNEENSITKTDDFGRILPANHVFEEEKQEDEEKEEEEGIPSALQNVLEALNMKLFNHESNMFVV